MWMPLQIMLARDFCEEAVDCWGRGLAEVVKTTPYFDWRRQFPDRRRITDEWIERVISNPERELVQSNSRIARWGRYLSSVGDICSSCSWMIARPCRTRSSIAATGPDCNPDDRVGAPSGAFET